jgi:hypothetical protein
MRNKLAVVSYEYGTLAIEVCLFVKFRRRLFFNVLFPLPPSTDNLLGNIQIHVTTAKLKDKQTLIVSVPD